MFKNKRKNFILALFIGLVFALVPVSFVQAAPSITVDVDAISIGDITSVDGKPSIEVTGLPVGAIVKVYDQVSDGKLLGSATVKTGQTSAIVSLPNLNGDVYVSVTLESDRSTIKVVETDVPDSDSISVVNNAGTADTVTVTDLKVGDIVKVYDEAGSKLLGKATVAKGKTEAVVSISQLGMDDGKVIVTLTSLGKKESDIIKAISYDAEPQTYALEEHNIVITNNAGLADIVTVSEDKDGGILEVGDIVKVYDKEGTKLLGKATAVKVKDKGKTEAVVAVVSIRQLGTGVGKVQVSVTSKGNRESEKCSKDYKGEDQTSAPSVTNISVENKTAQNDSVTVTGLSAGDIVKVYRSETEGNLLGKATVAKDKNQAVVIIRQLSIDKGSVWVTVTSIGQKESPRVEQVYSAQ